MGRAPWVKSSCLTSALPGTSSIFCCTPQRSWEEPLQKVQNYFIQRTRAGNLQTDPASLPFVYSCVGLLCIGAKSLFSQLWGQHTLHFISPCLIHIPSVSTSQLRSFFLLLFLLPTASINAQSSGCLFSDMEAPCSCTPMHGHVIAV